MTQQTHVPNTKKSGTVLENPLNLPKWPTYTEPEIERVANVLRSGRVNYWTGNECREFEREFAAYIGVKHGIALANGTLALELGLRVLGIGKGDEVVVTPRTYIASVSSIVLAGAKPIFADIEPETQTITAESIQAVLSPRTRAVIAVHLGGWPCEMQPIMALARKHSLKVIEDCAQAHGAKIHNQLVGSFGDASAFSFCQDKIISTGGEGGMLLLNDDELHASAWSFKDHGKNPAKVHAGNQLPGFRWVHDDIGTNWRMTEVQAAIGRMQLARLEENVSQRRRVASLLDQCFEKIRGVQVVRAAHKPHMEPSFYKYYLFLKAEYWKKNWSRERLLQATENAGLPCMVGSCPEVYLEKSLSVLGYAPQKRLPKAQQLGETSLAISINHLMTDDDAVNLGRAVQSILVEAMR